MKNNLYYIILIFFIILRPAYSIELKKVILIGNTIELEIENELNKIKGDYYENDIKSLGVKVTDEYRGKGYSTSYVLKLVVAKDDVLEIHVKESRIIKINITGLDNFNENTREELLRIFNSFEGSIYNKFILQRSAEDVKKKFNLGSIKIYPINYEDTGDVFLSLKLGKKIKGNFYGGIGFEPIYGISPELGYVYPFKSSGIDIYTTAGFREGEFKKVEGEIKYFLFAERDSYGFYLSLRSGKTIEYYQSREHDYTHISVTPAVGFRSAFDSFFLDAYIEEISSLIFDYRYEENKLKNYDSRLTVDLGYSNGNYQLVKEDSTQIKLSFSGGLSNFDEKGYLITSAGIRSAYSPVVRLRFIPKINFYYTTSDERFSWSYVFNKNLLGFFNDYTASQWKNTAGLDMEMEISPQFVYAGPFVNCGYFLDEKKDWKFKTGGGAKGTIIVKKATVEIYYAWDLSAGFLKGGVAILAGGRF